MTGIFRMTMAFGLIHAIATAVNLYTDGRPTIGSAAAIAGTKEWITASSTKATKGVENRFAIRQHQIVLFDYW